MPAAIVRYSPWALLRDIKEDVNHMFERNAEDRNLGQWIPHVDIVELSDKYCVTADLPGVDPKNIKVSMEGKILSIRGERREEKQKEEGGYSRIERFLGEFHRQFTLPDNVNVNNIQAKSKNGVLELSIPKRESNKVEKIEVMVED